MKSYPRQDGFTLLEVLLIVAAVAILAGIIILALNPTEKLEEARNAERESHVETLANAIKRYTDQNSGVLPSSITVSDSCGHSANEICKTGGNCMGLVDLGVLTDEEKYLTAIPVDPAGSTTNGSGYHIARTPEGDVTICAPLAEGGEVIDETRNR